VVIPSVLLASKVVRVELAKILNLRVLPAFCNSITDVELEVLDTIGVEVIDELKIEFPSSVIVSKAVPALFCTKKDVVADVEPLPLKCPVAFGAFVPTPNR
jgi:hypothetical protein